MTLRHTGIRHGLAAALRCRGERGAVPMWQMLSVVALLAVITLPGWSSERFGTKGIFYRMEKMVRQSAIVRISTDDLSTQLATVPGGNEVRLWSGRDGHLIKLLRVPMQDVDAAYMKLAIIDGSGRTLAAAGRTLEGTRLVNVVYLFDVVAGRLFYRLGHLPQLVRHMAFSRNGDFLALMMGGGGGLRIYRVRDGALVGQDGDYDGDCQWGTFSNDGRLAVSASDGQIRLYNRNFRRIARKRAPGGKQPYQIDFSPDGRELAVGFSDGRAINVMAGHTLNFLHAPRVKKLIGKALPHVSWSAVGNYLYAGGDGGKIRRWASRGYGRHQDYAVSGAVSDMQARRTGGLYYITQDLSFGLMDAKGRQLFLADGLAEGPQLFGKNAVPGAVRKPGAVSTLAMRSARDATFSRGSGSPPVRRQSALRITDWKHSTNPKLNGRPLPLERFETSRALAIAPDGRHFVLGASWNLYLFDRQGNLTWKVPTNGTVWEVRISDNGQIVEADFGSGGKRRYRLSDGEEVLSIYPR